MSNWQRWKGIMKCYPFEEKRLAKWRPPYIVQPKYDGFRCRVVPTEGGNLLLSSEENVFYSVPHLNEMFNRLSLGYELDGELYCHGMDFDSLSSIVSRTVNLHPDHKLIKFHCFDIINEFDQISRLLEIEKLRSLSDNLVVAPFWMCESLDEIMRAYDEIIEAGFEGIIVRHLDAPYQRKRSTWVMKFKPKKEDEYEVIGFQEEFSVEGTPKNSLGALICKSGDGNIFNVGTGFSRDQRDYLWSIREELPSKTARLQYQHLTSGKKVPRFPVFMEII